QRSRNEQKQQPKTNARQKPRDGLQVAQPEHGLHRVLDAARTLGRKLTERVSKQEPRDRQEDGEHRISDRRHKVSRDFTSNQAKRSLHVSPGVRPSVTNPKRKRGSRQDPRLRFRLSSPLCERTNPPASAARV